MIRYLYSLFVSVLCFGPSVGMAQRNAPPTDLNVSYSQAIKVGDGYKFSQFIETPDQRCIAIFHKGKDLYRSFELDLASMTAKKLGTLEMKQSKDQHHFIMVGDRLLLPYFVSSKEDKTNCLYIQELDVQTMQPINDPLAVDCLEGKDFYQNFDNSFAATKVSPDGRKLLVYYKLPEPEEGGKLFRFSVYDDQLNQLWRKDVPTKIEEGILRIGDADWFMADAHYGVAVVSGQGANHTAIGLDNFGNVFFWSRVDFGRDQGKYHRFQTFWSKVNGTTTDHIHMDRGSGTQATRSFDPVMHISNRKATLVEYFADEGRGGFAFMVASTQDAADGFHYAQWSEQYRPENFYEHLFSIDEVVVAASRSQYNKIKAKEREGKSIMVQPFDCGIRHVPGTDEVYINVYQAIHGRYNFSAGAFSGGGYPALLSYYLSEDENLSYLGGFAYAQGEHLNNYAYLGIESLATHDAIYYVFNDNRRNLSSKFDPREEVHPFFTAPNPISLVPMYKDATSFKNGKRQQLMTSKQLGDNPLDVATTYSLRSGQLLSCFLTDDKYTIAKLEPKL
ncbi:MAG: hypothetical protein GC178_15985 [Flavobacteriales bacterium]|nr:hypothetical protein [Flavobacteriales bacterium]